MWYFLALVIDGALAGAIHALIALAFVLVSIRQA
jgi:branched-subunit amino acid ABC-type transport system permease component